MITLSGYIHIFRIFSAVKTLTYVLFSSYKKGNPFQKVIQGESLLIFPKLYKPTPNDGLFSVQRNFLSGKIIRFVQFVRMRLYYRLSTKTHHISVQSEPFHSEAREWTKYPPILSHRCTGGILRGSEKEGQSLWFC